MGTLETSQSSAATKRTANREKPAPRAAGDSGAGLRALVPHSPQHGWNEMAQGSVPSLQMEGNEWGV